MWWKLPLFCSLFYLAHFLTEKATDGFAVAALSSDISPTFPNMGDEEIAKEALSQPYTYLDCGGQSHVFISEDKKYVIKFFRNHPHIGAFLPKVRERALRKLTRDLDGYVTAFEKMAAECALIYGHFSKTEFPPVVVRDKIGIIHTIPLTDTQFIVQKRALSMKEYLDEHPQQEALGQVMTLLVRLSEVGLRDHDPRLYKNVGFVEGKAVLFDPGRIVHEPEENPHFPEKFKAWLSKNYSL